MLHLFCDSIHGIFTLTDDDESWSQSFESFEQSYDSLEARISGETPLVLHNANGAVIFQTTIFPLEPELLKARARWHEIAVSEPFES